MGYQLYTGSNVAQMLAEGVKVCMVVNSSGNEITTNTPIYTAPMTPAQIISYNTITMPVSSSGTTLA